MKKRHKGFLILPVVELLIVLILFARSFTGEEMICSFDGKGIQDLAVRTTEYVGYDSDRMTITPGVYRIKVQSVLGEDQRIYVKLACDSSYFKALRGNGILIHSGSDTIEFDVYVLDTVTSAYVQSVFYGTDTDALIQLEVNKTGLGSRILAFILMLVFAAVDFLVWFRRRILKGEVSKKKQVAFWTLTAGILLAYFPYLTDYFFFGDNTIPYLRQIVELKESLMQGTSLQQNGPIGFLTSGELFLLIPALFLLVGLSIMDAYKLFVLLVMTVTSFVTYHFLKKCVRDEYAALSGSMLYLLMPYHISGIYSKGAVGEFVAMCFLPLVCCGIYLLIMGDVASKEYGKYKWYSICGLTALLLCEEVQAGAVAAVLASLLASVLVQRMTENYGNRAWAAVGVVGIMGLLSVVRLVDKMVFEAKPVYLYDIKNLGTVGMESSEPVGYQNHVFIFIIGLTVILGINFFRKKRKQYGNQS